MFFLEYMFFLHILYIYFILYILYTLYILYIYFFTCVRVHIFSHVFKFFRVYWEHSVLLAQKQAILVYFVFHAKSGTTTNQRTFLLFTLRTKNGVFQEYGRNTVLFAKQPVIFVLMRIYIF